MAFTVTLTSDKTVTIGESDRANNRIGLDISSAEQVPGRITVTVGCNGQPTDLLDSKGAGIAVGYQLDGRTGAPTPMSAVSGTPDDKRAWNTGSRPIALGGKVSLSLADFLWNTPPGDAEIEVRIETFDRGWSDGGLFTERVTKTVAVTSAPTVHYFTVYPDYVLHAGQTPVALSFYATGYETLALFRNNEEVGVWTSEEEGVAGSFPDRPSITSAYRLEATYSPAEEPDKDVREVLYRSVQVISPGWNAIGLPQGSPVRLFVANDFSGSGADRLYGIFKDSKDQYALYSSATGVDAWRLEKGDVPHHMATSPGVYYKNKLWLIGGSAVEDKKVSSEVWCYAVDNNSQRNPWQEMTVKTPMPARMGHACVVFPDGSSDGVIWVLGGYSSDDGGAFDAVYRLQEEAQGAVTFDCLNEHAWGKRGRLKHAAATFRNEKGQVEVWVYGGAEHPQSEGLTDLWSTTNGSEWDEVKMDGSESALVPDPGRPFASALVAFPPVLPADAKIAAHIPANDRLFLLGSFQEWAMGKTEGIGGNRISSFIFEWHSGTSYWEARPILSGWQQFQGDIFYMQAIAFNRFLFVWSLTSHIGETLKLNILIS